MGENPPDGAVIDYALAAGDSGPVTLEIADSSKELVVRFSSNDKPPPIDMATPISSYWLGPPRSLTANTGMNRFVWNLRYPSPPVKRPRLRNRRASRRHTSLAAWSSGCTGVYQVTLTVGGRVFTQPLVVEMDPRVTTGAADLSRLLTLERQSRPPSKRAAGRSTRSMRPARATRQQRRRRQRCSDCTTRFRTLHRRRHRGRGADAPGRCSLRRTEAPVWTCSVAATSSR